MQYFRVLFSEKFSDKNSELYDSLEPFIVLQSLNAEDKFVFIMSYG